MFLFQKSFIFIKLPVVPESTTIVEWILEASKSTSSCSILFNLEAIFCLDACFHTLRIVWSFSEPPILVPYVASSLCSSARLLQVSLVCTESNTLPCGQQKIWVISNLRPTVTSSTTLRHISLLLCEQVYHPSEICGISRCLQSNCFRKCYKIWFLIVFFVTHSSNKIDIVVPSISSSTLIFTILIVHSEIILKSFRDLSVWGNIRHS